MAAFPVKGTGPGDLSQGESPSMYENVPIDDTAKAESEGGYEFRRRRSTRARRRKIDTGFIMLSHADYLKLDAFWEAHTTVVAFTYFDYMHDVTRQVRFDEFKPDYVGVGQNRMWTIKIQISEI
jgi:hypothetical protein